MSATATAEAATAAKAAKKNVIDASLYNRFFDESWKGLPTTTVYNAHLGNVETLRLESLEDVRAVEDSIRCIGGDDTRVRKMVKMIVLWSIYFGYPLEFLWSTELRMEDPLHRELLEQHVDRLRARHLRELRELYDRFPDTAGGPLDLAGLDEVQKEKTRVMEYINQTSVDLDWPIVGFRHC